MFSSALLHLTIISLGVVTYMHYKTSEIHMGSENLNKQDRNTTGSIVIPPSQPCATGLLSIVKNTQTASRYCISCLLPLLLDSILAILFLWPLEVWQWSKYALFLFWPSDRQVLRSLIVTCWLDNISHDKECIRFKTSQRSDK